MIHTIKQLNLYTSYYIFTVTIVYHHSYTFSIEIIEIAITRPSWRLGASARCCATPPTPSRKCPRCWCPVGCRGDGEIVAIFMGKSWENSGH